MGNVYVFDHPLIQHKTAMIRKKETSVKDFRELVREISMLMGYEATRKLPLEEVKITTPICDTTVNMLKGEDIAIVPILRAGLGMVDGMLALVPNAKVGHIGLYRDPQTHEPIEYDCKLPNDIDIREIFVVDPMLATGGSAAAAIDFIKERGGRKIIFMCLIAAPEGIEVLQKAHPDVYVKVESGVSGDDAVTTSDAIRTLNTEVMGGNGPDILLMDGLPVNSYVEKGLLADVSDTVNPLISDGKLFDKIAQTYKGDDGKIYAVPMTFQVPIVIGRKSDLDKLNNLSDFASLAQDFVKDHKKNENFIESYSLYSLVGDMMYTNSASWFKEDGSLDSDSLKSYLNDIKTIYNAVYETLSDKDKSDMDQMKQYYASEDYEMDASWYGSDPSYMAMYIMAGMNRIAYGNMAGTSSLGDLASIMRKDADINYKALPGSVQNVYVPSEIIGINAKSKNIDTAKEFYAFALSADGQKAIDSYSGFPVNKERFDASLVDPDAGTEGYDPNESKGSWGMTDEDGNEISVDSYWPTDDQIAQLKNLIDSLDTPSYGDYTILSTILKDSMNAIIGDTSVDDAVEQVVKDIDIYLSE